MKTILTLLLIIFLFFISNLYSQIKTLNDLMELQDGKIMLKCNMKILIPNLITIPLPKGTIIASYDD